MFSALKFKNLADLTAFFDTEEKCIDYVEETLWKGKPTCPHCGHQKAYKLNDGRHKCANPECHKKFSVKVGTIFQGSPIPLRKWFIAVYLISAHKKGISSCQLARDIGVCQKTAWFMEMRIREVFNLEIPEKMTGISEIDETYVGGKEKNKHAAKKSGKRGRSTAGGKIPLVGMVCREKAENGVWYPKEVRCFPVEKTDAKTLMGLIKDNIAENSTVITDNFKGYNEVGLTYAHGVVNHSTRHYVRACPFQDKVESHGNPMHTNTIESFWACVKRSILGIYHKVSKKHMKRYCAEWCYRYNNRQTKDITRFNMVVSGCQKRLLYKDLIKKVA